MVSKPVVIIGAGGHAAVVADALLAAGETVLGCTDADAARRESVCGIPVLGDDTVLETMSVDAVQLANGIGGVRGEAARRNVQARLQERGWRFVEVRHPTAIVSRFAQIGAGVHLMAGSIVQAGASIGDGCIVNTAAVIEHDVQLGAWVHVAPRAVVCGSVRIGAMSHVGAGAVVRQGLQLGEGTVVGAGAVLVKDTPGDDVWVGTPARPVERKR